MPLDRKYQQDGYMLDGVSLEQLLFFIAAAEEGSFSAAGRRLKRAQSVVSQTVSNLEGHLGMRLFDRTARFPVLTDQGRALLANARAVTSQMDLLKARVKGLAGGSEPDLTMVVDPTLPIAMFTEAVAALREQFPETAIRLHVGGWGAAIQYVLDGRCAIGITASLITTPAELAREPLMEINMATVVSSLHPLASYRGPIPATILAKHIQLIHTDRSDLLPGRDSGMLSPKTWLLSHIEFKLAFVRAGFGFGCLPLHMVERDLASGALVQIRAEDSPPFCGNAIEMTALYRLDSPPGPAGRWFIDRMHKDKQRAGANVRTSSSVIKSRSSRRRKQRSKPRS